MKGTGCALFGIVTCHRGGHDHNRGMTLITSAIHITGARCSYQGCDTRNRSSNARNRGRYTHNTFLHVKEWKRGSSTGCWQRELETGWLRCVVRWHFLMASPSHLWWRSSWTGLCQSKTASAPHLQINVFITSNKYVYTVEHLRVVHQRSSYSFPSNMGMYILREISLRNYDVYCCIYKLIH